MFQQTMHKFLADHKDLRTERTILAIVVTFVISLIAALYNGMDFVGAVKGALYLSLFTGAIVAVLAWGVDTAKQKGYSGVLGFVAILFLNVFGILLLLLLPKRCE